MPDKLTYEQTEIILREALRHYDAYFYGRKDKPSRARQYLNAQSIATAYHGRMMGLKRLAAEMNLRWLGPTKNPNRRDYFSAAEWDRMQKWILKHATPLREDDPEDSDRLIPTGRFHFPGETLLSVVRDARNAGIITSRNGMRESMLVTRCDIPRDELPRFDPSKVDLSPRVPMTLTPEQAASITACPR